MEPSFLAAETIRPLPDRLETGPLALGGTNWGQIGGSNWALAGGNRCFAGCPTIVVQLNIAVINQILVMHGLANGPRSH
ncbi:hypothetical protein [Thermorudis peleae]|uniref:hypothetical protein n=1 Tax=Thermorudis peleae TaxID=1382356 RepID=UPI000571748F|nr:hypothetical protein [Thermorudis peleae]MBX6754721.1 hypothetical protein [Thermorudis peleae]